MPGLFNPREWSFGFWFELVLEVLPDLIELALYLLVELLSLLH